MTEYQALDGRIANHLINGMALSYRRLANGSMIVIAPNGMKLIFGPEKVKVAEAQLHSAELPRESGREMRRNPLGLQPPSPNQKPIWRGADSSRAPSPNTKYSGGQGEVVFQ